MARSLNGTSDYILVSQDTPFDFERTSTFSILGWIKRAAAGVGHVIVAKGDNTNNNQWLVDVTTGDFLQLGLLSTYPTSALQVRGGTTLSASTWYHVAVTYDGSSTPGGVNLYVNGVLETPTTVTNTLTTSILNNLNLYIGCRNNQDIFFNGSLAEISIHNVVLSLQEIRGNYTAQRNFRGRVSYWPLWGTSTTEADLSGNAYNGAVTGTTVAAGPPTGRFPRSFAGILPGHGLVVPGSTCVVPSQDIMGIALPEFREDQSKDQFIQFLNDAMKRLEQTLNERVLVDAPCTACPDAAGKVVLDMSRCSNWVIDAADDINEIDIPNTTPGQNLDVRISNRGNNPIRIRGWPTSTATQGIPTSLNAGFSTSPSFKAGNFPTGSGRGFPPLHQRGVPGATPTGAGGGGGGAGGGALALVCGGGSCDLDCTEEDPSITFEASGGGAPYTWETTAGTLTTSGLFEATLTPPANTGSGVAGVAYDKHGCAATGPGTCRDEWGCNDQLLGTANPQGHDCHASGNAVTPSDDAAGSGICGCTPTTDGAYATMFNSCEKLAEEAHGFDLRTAGMITDGCNPCGLSMSGVVVTVTDRYDTSVSKTVTAKGEKVVL